MYDEDDIGLLKGEIYELENLNKKLDKELKNNQREISDLNIEKLVDESLAA